MKLLSVAVPCYNSQAYMEKCINSLLHVGLDVEILIINDGSTDNTGRIADEYANKYPDIIRVIHQKNGGHGAAVNTGIKNASGLFFKVVDSDDWVEEGAYRTVIASLRSLVTTPPDMVITNYVYEKTGKKNKKIIQYTNALPCGKMFTWSEIGKFNKGQYMLMHSLIYRTNLLRECHLKLPEHTFYVDNLYAFLPMIQVKTMFYISVDFYRYYIGREGQSVQEEIMIRRIDQQLYVNKLMFSAFDSEQIDSPVKKSYLFNYLEIVTIASTALLVCSNSSNNLQKRKELYHFFKTENNWLYKKLRHGFMGTIMNLPSFLGRKISVFAYKISRKIFGFN